MLKKIVGTIWRNLTPSLRGKVVRLTQNQFTVSVAAVVTNHQGEVLLLDHVLRTASGWGVPGGFVKHGEQPETAVRRELREETGIELSGVKLFSTRTINRHIEILFRAESNDHASVKSREINAVGWFKLDEMPESVSRMQKSVIEKLLEDSL
ncbi:MAG: NUDIX domain-containing protein [Pyrinomonadaceae bacterium]|nr:NUDIX domain-containing protein [Pyrinomonadaceae bacterium]